MPVEPTLGHLDESQIGHDHAQKGGEEAQRRGSESEGAGQGRQREGKTDNHAQWDAQR